MLVLFGVHPGTPQNCHCLKKIGNSQIPLQASVGNEGHGGPCLVLLSLQAGYTILMATQAKKLLKTEA